MNLYNISARLLAALMGEMMYRLIGSARSCPGLPAFAWTSCFGLKKMICWIADNKKARKVENLNRAKEVSTP